VGSTPLKCPVARTPYQVMVSLLLGNAGAKYETSVVLQAAGLTAAIYVCLTADACVTKTDFTGCDPFLCAALCVLILGSILLIIFPSELGHIVWDAPSCALFSFYSIYGKQLILGGGDSANDFAIDDYCFAALNLYMDVIKLFINLVRLLSARARVECTEHVRALLHAPFRPSAPALYSQVSLADPAARHT